MPIAAFGRKGFKWHHSAALAGVVAHTAVAWSNHILLLAGVENVNVGGGAGSAQMGASTAELADNSGPLEKRLVSKNWSVRANAYEELTTMSKNA